MSDLNDSTLIVTAFNRPNELEACVKSVRKFYPTLKIIISDNGRPFRETRKLLEGDYGCYYLQLPFDSGVSHSKNMALDIVKTKYAIIIDDDFIFTEKTNLEKLKAVLDGDPSVGVVGGCPHTSGGKIGTAGSVLRIDHRHGFLVRRPIKDPDWQKINGIKYFYADFIRQFLIIRNTPELRWEKRMKIRGLHLYFFLKIKEDGKWKVAYVPEVMVLHDRARPSPEYKQYRQRNDAWRMFYEITGIKYGIFDNHTVIDYENATRGKYKKFFFQYKRTIPGYSP